MTELNVHGKVAWEYLRFWLKNWKVYSIRLVRSRLLYGSETWPVKVWLVRNECDQWMCGFTSKKGKKYKALRIVGSGTSLLVDEEWQINMVWTCRMWRWGRLGQAFEGTRHRGRPEETRWDSVRGIWRALANHVRMLRGLDIDSWGVSGLTQV